MILENNFLYFLYFVGARRAVPEGDSRVAPTNTLLIINWIQEKTFEKHYKNEVIKQWEKTR